MGGRGGSTLSSNSSEMAWNFQMPFYRMGTDSLRMVYVNFHKSICLRDFSGRGGYSRGGYSQLRALSPNSSEMAWNFQTPFYRMGTDRLRMVYVNFHKSICLRDFSGRGGFRGSGGVSFVAELLRDGLEFPNAILQDGSR